MASTDFSFNHLYLRCSLISKPNIFMYYTPHFEYNLLINNMSFAHSGCETRKQDTRIIVEMTQKRRLLSKNKASPSYVSLMSVDVACRVLERSTNSQIKNYCIRIYIYDAYRRYDTALTAAIYMPRLNQHLTERQPSRIKSHWKKERFCSVSACQRAAKNRCCSSVTNEIKHGRQIPHNTRCINVSIENK